MPELPSLTLPAVLQYARLFCIEKLTRKKIILGQNELTLLFGTSTSNYQFVFSLPHFPGQFCTCTDNNVNELFYFHL